MNRFEIIHNGSGLILAEGAISELKTLEGNFYIKSSLFKEGVMRINYLPGLCIYKFIYLWVDLVLPNEKRVRNIGWKYILPNPLFFTIIGRIGIPMNHPELLIKKL